jgi:hypothetical protein
VLRCERYEVQRSNGCKCVRGSWLPLAWFQRSSRESESRKFPDISEPIGCRTFRPWYLNARLHPSVDLNVHIAPEVRWALRISRQSSLRFDIFAYRHAKLTCLETGKCGAVAWPACRLRFPLGPISAYYSQLLTGFDGIFDSLLPRSDHTPTIYQSCLLIRHPSGARLFAFRR